MKRISMLALLCGAAALVCGCSTASAACPGGRCASVGVWSPWGGVWYYQTQCAGGKCAAKPAEPEEPKEAPEAVPEEPADEVPVIAEPEFKPFCVRVAELVNKQRAALGLAPLELDPALCSGCDRHSAWMANGGGFQHGYYGGRECIAYGVRTPEALVNMWLGSSGHRAILLGAGRIVGVGTSGGYWTLRIR